MPPNVWRGASKRIVTEREEIASLKLRLTEVDGKRDSEGR